MSSPGVCVSIVSIEAFDREEEKNFPRIVFDNVVLSRTSKVPWGIEEVVAVSREFGDRAGMRLCFCVSSQNLAVDVSQSARDGCLQCGKYHLGQNDYRFDVVQI